MITTHCIFLEFDELRIEPTSYVPKSYFLGYIHSMSTINSVLYFMGVRTKVRSGNRLTAMRNYTHVPMVF